MSSTPLNDSWTIWAKYSGGSGGAYNKNFTKLATFDTIENFWRYWNHIPSPGRVFYDGNEKKGVGPDGRQIEEYCFFKTGIEPMWEGESSARRVFEWRSEPSVSRAKHVMAWHGMAWHGMAWHGMAWHVIHQAMKNKNNHLTMTILPPPRRPRE